MPGIPRTALLLTLLAPAAALGQATTPAPAATPPAAPQLSPKAAYDLAMRPLEVTRHSVANWSDAELAALSVTMSQAAAACDARDPKNFNGADLIDLAQLCSLGLDYPTTVRATLRYIKADAPKPQLTQAYASLVDALLRLKDEHDALTYTQAMLDAVPYDAQTAATTDDAIAFMQFVYTPDALALALKREPLLLDRLRAATAAATQPAATPATPPAPIDAPQQSIHELYSDGLFLAELQQLSKSPPADVAATVAALDAALPPQPVPDEAIPIAIIRRSYALLGKPLPSLAHPAHPANPKQPVAMKPLDVLDRLPQIPARNAVTALLLFPDWCAQCVRMATKLPQTVFSVAGHEAYLYGLMAQTVPANPPPKDPKAPPAPFTAADAANYLRNTPTLVVDPSLLDQFAATDVPLLILADAQGMVRVLQAVSDDAIEPGGTIDSAIALVGKQWPSHLLKPPAPLPPKP